MHDPEFIKIKRTGLWLRIHLLGTFPLGTSDLATVPVNQYWELHYISTNGLSLKSPEFIVRVNEYLLVVIGKEGFGQELTGGDAVALPGERLTLSVAAEGRLEATLVFKRKLLDDSPTELPIEPEQPHHTRFQVGAQLELDALANDPLDVGIR